MKRRTCKPRDHWQAKVEALGLVYHSLDATYWDESAYYAFTLRQVEEIERASNELHQLCLKAAQTIIDRKWFGRLGIPEAAVPRIIAQWEKEPPAIYGRFDLAYDGRNPPKMLEYNADTPTSLLEAAVVQWYWLEERFPDRDQFNSLHERLVAKWRDIEPHLYEGDLFFGYLDGPEDLFNVAYLMDTAAQAGLKVQRIEMGQIGWNNELGCFVDQAENPIDNIFKLYPWEWLLADEFGSRALAMQEKMVWIEPIWKMLLANKGILAILWELFPGHPNLLECRFEPGSMASYVQKPLLSREGANVSIVRNHYEIEANAGDYGAEGYVYQSLADIPQFDGNHPVIGSWMIDQECAGIGIRESNHLITDNLSRFVPHVIE